MPLTFISLFSGIGGLDLGFERAGLRLLAQVEIDEYCRRVLARHWPDVPRFADIHDVGRHNLPVADVLAGGFPCQDLSQAGRHAGIAGPRSSLWRQYARLIGELRPRFALVENVPALLWRGMDTVCGDLAALGYDAEWGVISACAFGAPHTRERLFILAYPAGVGLQPRAGLPNALQWDDTAYRRVAARTDWAAQSGVGRTAYGVPAKVDRLRGIGNSVAPPVAEYLGRLICQAAA